MCYAGNCHPDCDNCRPKHLTCPDCGANVPLVLAKCPLCNHVITEDDRAAGIEDWRQRHPYTKLPGA